MHDFSNYSLQQIAQMDRLCECGQRHYTDIQHIVIEPGALKKLPWVAANILGHDGLPAVRGTVVLSEDANTRRAAGDEACTLLTQAGCRVVKHCFMQPELVACAEACDELKAMLPADTTLLVAVGSGTVNDITKYVSFQTGIPFMIVATAPSMDGYASPVAPLVVKGLKYTFDAVSPAAIVGDIDVIRQAPLRMMSAGYGDIAGKCVSICDWKIASIVTGEAFCDTVANTVLIAAERCTQQLDGLLRREPQSVQRVMEALVLCGLMMNYMKSSRPASGSEHNFGHFVELHQLGAKSALSMHGEGVAVGSVLSAAFLHWIAQQSPDGCAARGKIACWDRARWELEMRRISPTGWQDVLKIEAKEQKNEAVTALPRLEATLAGWKQIVSAVQTYVPPCEVLRSQLARGGAPTAPAQLPSITPEVLQDAVRYAKDVRYRYSVLQMAWDLGLMDDMAKLAASMYDAPSSKA